MYLCLDLSTTCTGWSKFTKDGKLLKKGRIIPDDNLSLPMKNHYIVEQLKSLYNDVDHLVIEDIYLGVNVTAVFKLAKLAGAVVESWVSVKYKDPTSYTAVRARSLVKVNAHSHKAEIQIFIIDKYQFAKKKLIVEFKKKVTKLKKQLKLKKLSRSRYKYRMDKLSDIIDAETDIGEDVADSILLGLAYQEDINGKK